MALWSDTFLLKTLAAYNALQSYRTTLTHNQGADYHTEAQQTNERVTLIQRTAGSTDQNLASQPPNESAEKVQQDLFCCSVAPRRRVDPVNIYIKSATAASAGANLSTHSPTRSKSELPTPTAPDGP